MFDCYLTFDLTGSNRQLDLIQSFSDESYYNSIPSNSFRIQGDSYYCEVLERFDFDKNFFDDDNVFLCLYGFCYTNNKYVAETGGKIERLNAAELYSLYKKYGNDFCLYVKGTFVFVLYDKVNKVVNTFLDRHNVLPLYYFFRQNLLVISSNTSLISKNKFVSKEIDQQAIAEQLIFDYCLSDRYYYREIRQMLPATIYEFRDEKIESRQYWDVSSLYSEKLLGNAESLELLSKQLYSNCNLYANEQKNRLVSFTGGFDGRTNVAMLHNLLDSTLCYSYGIEGSLQLTIPEDYCQKNNVSYKAIFLDKDFEDKYANNSLKAVYFSNGTAPIIRSNFLYASEILKDYSSLNITGLFGSEILRPIHNLGIIFNDYSESLFFGDKRESFLIGSLTDLLKTYGLNVKDHEYLARNIYSHFEEQYFKKYSDYSDIIKLFFFIIQEGIRKYFMQQLQVERVYLDDRYPYFDSDFIDLIYRTPFAGMYNGFLGKSKYKRRKGQLLYAHVIKKYDGRLGAVDVDRGYAPNDLLLKFPFNYLKIALGVYKTKKNGPDKDFDTEKWVMSVMNKLLDQQDHTGIFETNVMNKYKTKEFNGNLLKKSHMLSLKHFLNRGI